MDIVTGIASCPRTATVPTNEVALHAYTISPKKAAKNAIRLTVNGLAVYRGFGCSGINIRCKHPHLFDFYFVPSLDLNMELFGPLSNQVLHTLTYSPRAVALASGPSPRVRSWRLISYGGLEVMVPPSWPVRRAQQATSCFTNPLWLSVTSVQLHVGEPISQECPLVLWLSPRPPSVGLVILQGQYGPIGRTTPLEPCFEVHRVSVCPTTDPAGVLVAAVHLPSGTPLTIELGLAGSGRIDRAVLRSFRLAP